MRIRQLWSLYLLIALVVLSMHRTALPEVPKGYAFYVSPDGNDAASGTDSTEAFATIQRARDAIRERKSAATPDNIIRGAGVTVWICGGRYYQDQTFELAPEDSGTAEVPIVYRAVPGAQVSIIGGREVSGWQKVQDEAVLARLEPAGRGEVYQADLRAQGIGDFGRFRSRGFARQAAPAALELFFQDKPMSIARWPGSNPPSAGFLRIVGYPEASRDDHGGDLGKLAGGFNYEGDRPNRWKDTNDIWVHGYWAYDWANSYEHIESIDIEKHLIKTSPPYGNYGFRVGGAGGRFYFLNILEELDEAGEWYMDRKSGILYFWPPAPLEQGKTMVSIVESPVIYINGASHITIRGLTVECTRGDGIRISGGSNNLVAECVLRNIGNCGITVSGGKNNGVVGCDIYETGDGGVSLSGGDRKTLTPAGHFAHNNHIHHVARDSWFVARDSWFVARDSWFVARDSWFDSLFTIHDSRVGGRAMNTPRMFLSGVNEIHHVCLETGDVGAIYTGRDYTFRGNIIRYNFIHHTGGVGMGSMGIYMDDCVSGTQIYGNVLWKLHRAVFLGGGRDFKVENNIFIDCDPAIEIDGRGLSKAPVWHNMVYQTMKQCPRQKHSGVEKYYAKDEGVPPGQAKFVVRSAPCVVRDALCVIRNTIYAIRNTKFVVRRASCVVQRNTQYALRNTKRLPFEQIGPALNHTVQGQVKEAADAKEMGNASLPNKTGWIRQAHHKENSLYVGWASEDITPKKPVALTGQLHKRISKSVLDPLTATVLALEDREKDGKKEQAIMVSCDLLYIRKLIQERLRDLVKPRVPDFDVRKLFLTATHTHTGPGFIDDAFGDLYDVSKDEGVMKASEYADFFLEQVADAVVTAWQNRKPGGVSWALGHAVVGMNRRAHYFDGSSAMYGNTNAENFSNIEGYEDHAVEMLFFWEPNQTRLTSQKLTGIVVNIACTSQETENLGEVSADFWHETREEIRKRYSQDIFIFPQCAAAGDISPHPLFRNEAEQIMQKRRGISRRQEIARRIANAVDEVFSCAKADIKTELPFRHTVVSLELPEAQSSALPFYQTDSVKPIEFHVIRLGDVAIATNPFEMFLDYGIRIKARSRAVLTLLVNLSCQHSGYLPTEKAVKGGGYSADKYIVGPEGGQMLVNETVKRINELW